MSFFTAEEVERFDGVVRCALLAELHFASGTMGVWNGNTTLTVNGVDFTPAYGAGTIDGLSFAGGVSAERVTLTIPAVDDVMLGKVLADTSEIEQRLMKLYLQFFDDDWQVIAAAPVLFFGFMQPPEVSRTEVTEADTEGPVQSASLASENIFFAAGLPSGGRNTDRDQQQRSPGDRIFRFTASLRNKKISYPDV